MLRRTILNWRGTTATASVWNRLGNRGNYGQIALSPDDKRLAVERPDTDKHWANVWILELSSGIFSRLTFSDDMDPVWSPDGREVLFTSRRGDRFGLYRKVVGGGDETPIFDSGEDLYSENWLPDGKSIVIIDQRGKAFSQLPLSGDRKPASSVPASVAERIRIAKTADTEACRAYHQHVNEHGCV